MLFGKKKDPAEELLQQKHEKSRQLTLAALQEGHLPPDAVNRLTNGVQSTDLSCNEFLLAAECGCSPLGMVMGSSFYAIRYSGQYANRWSRTTGELLDLTRALQHARQLAVGRLRMEAALLGAHGVIGVRLTMKHHSWGGGQYEFTAVGTAVRIEGMPDTKEPFTSDLSGQEFWKLFRSGYLPTGLVYGVCCYYIACDNYTYNLTRNFWSGGNGNQELVLYTQGFNTARHLAMGRLREEVRRAGGIGAVGMDIEYDIDEEEYEPTSGTRYIDLVIRFVAIGTAITRNPHQPAQKPAGTLKMYDLSGARMQTIAAIA